MMAREFVWQARPLRRLGDILKAAQAIQHRDEAKEFVQAYLEITPYARANLGYMFGYLEVPERERLQRLFDAPHPFFGFDHPTAKEALEMGMRYATHFFGEES